MEIYNTIQLVLLAIIFFGVFLHFLGFVGLLNFRFRKASQFKEGPILPSVTIIKSAHSNSDGEENNFKNFFIQDYAGSLQLLFVVSAETDPIVPIIRELLRKHPDKNAKLIISKTRNAYWKKIDALFDAHSTLTSDIVIWSDSDVIVAGNYVSQMVTALRESGVSVVTTPQYEVGANNFATALKSLGNNCDVAAYVMIFDMFVHDKRAGFGQSLGFWLKDFKEFEEKAWDELNNSFADDVVLPTLFAERGKKVVYRNIFCPAQYSSKSFNQMRRQQEKFAICQKTFIGRVKYLLSIFMGPQVWAAVLLLMNPGSVFNLSLFFGVMVLRVLTSFSFEWLIMGTIRMTSRYFWVIPIWDLLHIYFVFYSYTQSFMHSDGVVYEFGKKFRLTRVTDQSKVKFEKVVSNSRIAETLTKSF